mgnify:CR=1
MTIKEIKKMVEANAQIPTSEIEQDIADTEAEISKMKREAEHLEKTPFSLRESRMNHLRASGRRSGIKERQKFVENLKAILQYRFAELPPKSGGGVNK